MGGKDGRRGSAGVVIAGFVLSLLISAQRVEHGSAGDRGAVSQNGMEIATIGFMGMFRNITRFIALAAAVEIPRPGDR